MKNSEIHTGLDHKEVRDFLTKQLVDSWKHTTPPPMPDPNTMDTLDWAIESAKNSKLLADQQIANLETKKAIIILIKKMGWSELDVSDVTVKDSEWWWSFIGTELEHEDLLQRIEEEERL